MNPTNRREAYLAKMAGMDVVTPEPVNREEAYMAQIADNAGGGSGGGGIETITITPSDPTVGGGRIEYAGGTVEYTGSGDTRYLTDKAAAANLVKFLADPASVCRFVYVNYAGYQTHVDMSYICSDTNYPSFTIGEKVYCVEEI